MNLPDLDPALVERVDSQMALAEALGRLRDAIAPDPEAAAAFDALLAAAQRWLDSG